MAFKIVKKDSLYLKFFTMVIIPVLLVFLSVAIIMCFNFQNSKKQLQSFAKSSLISFATESDEKMDSINSYAKILSNDPTFIDAMFDLTILSPEDLEHIKTILQTFASSHKIIESIHILDQEHQLVFDCTASYPMEKYYNEICRYDSYNVSYFKSFRFYEARHSRTLLPSMIEEYHVVSNVIPVIMQEVGDIDTKNYLIINVDINRLLSSSKIYNFTKNSQTYIFNKYSMHNFSNTEQTPTQLHTTDKLYTNLITNTSPFDVDIPKKGKCTVVSYSATNNLVGYTYYAAIPLNDITVQLLPYMLYSLLIALAFMLTAIFIAFKNTSRIYNPINKISNTLTASGSDLDQINVAAEKLLKQKKDLLNILPFAQERYLIQFLNSSEYAIDENSQQVLKDSLPFKDNYYAIVILQLLPTSQLYDTYSLDEYKNIQIGFYNIVKDTFAEKFSSLVLPSSADTLYIILNMKDDSYQTMITATLEDIRNYLKYDALYVTLSIGCSKIYHDIDGLKEAHKEAISNFKTFSYTNSVVVPSNEEINFVFQDIDENNLFNALASYKAEEAYKILDDIFKKNENTSNRSKRQLCTHILNVLFRVMRTKKIRYYTDKLDFEIFNEILDRPLDDVRNEIINIIDFIKHKSNETLSGNNPTAIIQYISDNYTNPNISLTSMSSVFNINSSYLSTIIRSNLGIGFHEHLTNLRVAKAKEMLVQTDDQVQEICIKCGFGSDKTFYRLFKNKTGVTPIEYRKNKKNT